MLFLALPSNLAGFFESHLTVSLGNKPPLNDSFKNISYSTLTDVCTMFIRFVLISFTKPKILMVSFFFLSRSSRILSTVMKTPVRPTPALCERGNMFFFLSFNLIYFSLFFCFPSFLLLLLYILYFCLCSFHI